jgi:hypothetical protein
MGRGPLNYWIVGGVRCLPPTDQVGGEELPRAAATPPSWASTALRGTRAWGSKSARASPTSEERLSPGGFEILDRAPQLRPCQAFAGGRGAPMPVVS